MKVVILILSTLAATLAGPHLFDQRETAVEGRQFSEDPIINYAGWGFIAGLADYFIRRALTPMNETTTTTTTTTVAPATKLVADAKKKMEKKEKKQRKQKKAERKAAKLAAKRKAEEEAKKAEAMEETSDEQVEESAEETVEI